MKKLLIILSLFLLVGCSSKVENPILPKNSLDEINEIAHGNIRKPGVMGITQEGFYIIESKEGNIAEYDFVLKDIGYTIRFSDTIVKKDISGIYIDGKPAFDEDIVNNTKAEGEGYFIARWFTTDGQYCFIAPDTIHPDLFTALLDEVSQLTGVSN